MRSIVLEKGSLKIDHSKTKCEKKERKKDRKKRNKRERKEKCY